MSLFLPIHSLTWVVSTSQGSSSTNTAVSSPTRASNLSSFFGPVARGCLCIQDVNLVFNAPSGVVAQKIKPRRMTGGTMILQAFALVTSLLVTKFILINKKKSSQEHKSGSHSISLLQVSDVDFIEMFTTFATTPVIIILFPNLYKDHKRKDCANAQVPGSIPGAQVLLSRIWQSSPLPFLRSTVLININLIQGTTGHTCECFYDELLSDVLRREVSTLSTHLAINRRHWKSMQSLLLYETKLFASIYVWIGTHNLQERIRSVIHTASRVKTLLKLWTVVWSVTQGLRKYCMHATRSRLDQRQTVWIIKLLLCVGLSAYLSLKPMYLFNTVGT